jgi:hypothetical protein
MKNLSPKFLFFLFQAVLLLHITSPIDAQSLPNVQNKDLLAPSNIKIDGNPIEWGGKYMAYNHVNYTFYSIANDADNLYLVVHINDRATIQKVLFGGITLTIDAPKSKASDQKKDGSNVKLKYPIPADTFAEVQKTFLPFTGSGVIYKDILDTSKTSKSKRDAMIITLNRNLENMFKEIEVSGIKDIEEPLLSIYNTDGIKVAARFNEHLQYTCEMAIPLKFLNADINNGVKFKYNIVVNGKPTSEKINGEAVPVPVGVSFGDAPPDPTEFYLFSATSFSGKYTLIKK